MTRVFKFHLHLQVLYAVCLSTSSRNYFSGSQLAFIFLYLRTKSCVEFLTVLGSTAIMASSLRHTGEKKITTKIWPLDPKQLLILPKFCLPLFISFFEDRNFGINSDKTLVDLLTFKFKE